MSSNPPPPQALPMPPTTSSCVLQLSNDRPHQAGTSWEKKSEKRRLIGNALRMVECVTKNVRAQISCSKTRVWVKGEMLPSPEFARARLPPDDEPDPRAARTGVLLVLLLRIDGWNTLGHHADGYDITTQHTVVHSIDTSLAP